MQGALAFAAPVFHLCILLDPRSTGYPLTDEHLRIRQEGQATSDQNQGDLNVTWGQKEAPMLQA